VLAFFLQANILQHCFGFLRRVFLTVALKFEFKCVPYAHVQLLDYIFLCE